MTLLRHRVRPDAQVDGEPETLIKEARRRQRRRGLLVLVVLAGLGTLGITLGLVASTSKSPTGPPSSLAIAPTKVLAAGTLVSDKAVSLVSFIDPVHGFGIVGPPGEPAALHQLAVSSDSGRTWRAVGAPLPDEPMTFPAPEDQQQGSFTFTSRSDGYLVAVSGFYETTDGGHHWQDVFPSSSNLVKTSMQPLYVAATGSSVWVLGDYLCLPPGAAQQQCSFGIEASPNGGKSWDLLSLPGPVAGIVAVDRLGPKRAQLLVQPRTNNAETPLQIEMGPTELLTSTDGGTTWTTSVGPHCSTKMTPAALVESGNQSVVMCEGQSMPRSAESEFWGAAHQATVWTLRSRLSSPEPMQPPQSALTGMELTAAGRILWASAPKGIFYRSEDRAATWRSVRVIPAANVGEQILFTNQGDGWAAAFGAGIWRTTDGGQTWQKAQSN